MRVVICGGSGLLGSELIRQLQLDPEVERICFLNRFPVVDLPSKVDLALVDYKKPETLQAHFHSGDLVICSVGTTRKEAGSKKAFAQVDRDIPILLGQLGKRAGCRSMVMVSSLGASRRSPLFYLRTKAQAEAELSKIGLNSLTIVQPSMLVGRRSPPRPLEQMGVFLFQACHVFLPKNWRPIPVSILASSIIFYAKKAREGIVTLPSKQLWSV